MPVYEIEQYELHVQKHWVEVHGNDTPKNRAEAIMKLFAGEGNIVEGGTEYVEVAEDFGMPADNHADLAEALVEGGVGGVDVVIPSIRSIKKIKKTTYKLSEQGLTPIQVVS